MVVTIGTKHLRLQQGDITRVLADAIVNAANSDLMAGSGVDGAIHRAGGPKIAEQLKEIRERIGQCPAGDAVVTTAGNLPAKWIIHAVGPVYHPNAIGQEDLLASCYSKALRLASERGARIVAFPSISTGSFGYPTPDAARIAINTVGAFLREEPTSVAHAIFVLFDDKTFDAYKRAAAALA
ncbi:MAG: O-acetyl-ADP-ribose deacetylase [Bryobacteraceae bacterium]